MKFLTVLNQNYQIMKSISLDPKISDGHPHIFNIRVLPLGDNVYNIILKKAIGTRFCKVLVEHNFQGRGV